MSSKPNSFVFIKRPSSPNKQKIDNTIKSIDHLIEHLKYIAFRSQELYQEEHKGLFSRDLDNANYLDFASRVANNKALKHPKCIKAHKLIFSLRQIDYEAYKRSNKDFKHLIRKTLEGYEKKYEVKLDWVANIHEVKGHPHCHVVVKAVSDNKGDRGFKRIKFKTLEDFADMKVDFEKEFMKDVQYRFFEREEIKDLMKDISIGFENLTKSIQQEINNEQSKGEYEKNKSRATGSNKEDVIRETEIKEKKGKNSER